jgi:heme A synthase
VQIPKLFSVSVLMAGLVLGMETLASAQTFSTIHTFHSGSNDGSTPVGGLVFDSLGNLYGTTYEGGLNGASCGALRCGTIFKLTPSAGGYRLKPGDQNKAGYRSA